MNIFNSFSPTGFGVKRIINRSIPVGPFTLLFNIKFEPAMISWFLTNNKTLPPGV